MLSVLACAALLVVIGYFVVLVAGECAVGLLSRITSRVPLSAVLASTLSRLLPH